ncbi:MAG: autotransporter outer membrane beta-barrel domain-containing protein [Thermoguttaceae bacterium]|nr:autotransporter outer membrane beta-barrel domain-containing protein [Thermoguttaceae bacterium]
MDVKQFFRKKLVAYVAALLSVGLCGLPRAYAADQNYQPDVSAGGTISGTYDISDYGVGRDNGFIATFQNPDGNMNATIQDWKVTNNSAKTEYGGKSCDGVVYYVNDLSDPPGNQLVRNPKLVLTAPTEAGTTDPRTVNISVKGTNEFGSSLNLGNWADSIPDPDRVHYDLFPKIAGEVDVLFGTMNDGNPEPDLYDGHVGAETNVTFETGSNSHFWGDVMFGGQDGANVSENAGNATVTFEDGSTTTFENQNTYFGGGGWNDTGVCNNGGNATVNFNGGTTTFNQRAVFGGGASNPSGGARVHVGNSDVTFNGGTNYFTGKNATYVDNQGNANQRNYYGVYFSSIGGMDGLAEGGTANVTINNGSTNTFDTEVHSVGNYDFTPYGDIIRSKDDFDVTWGGNSNILVTGGVTEFNGRSTFGAPNGKSTLSIEGGKVTFGGTVRSANMGKGDVLSEGLLDGVPFSDINTNYNGQDIPYVYFGGKKLTDEDVDYWNNYYDAPGHDAFHMETSDYDATAPQNEVTLSGRNKVVLNTTGFVGGANYKLLDGSYDIVNNYTDPLYKGTQANGFADGFEYGFKDGDKEPDPTNPDDDSDPDAKKFTVDYIRFNTNADTADTAVGDYEDGKVDNNPAFASPHQLIKDDAGAGTFTVKKGSELRLGLYNNTQLYNAPDQYIDPDDISQIDTAKNPGYTTNRNAQVQLLGNNGVFRAEKGAILYFTIDPNGTYCKNQQGEDVERLNVARIAFDEIHIDKNTKLYLDAAFPFTLCNELIGENGQDKEFYSIEAFFDTSNSEDKLDIPEDISEYGGNHLFYKVGIEGLADDATGDPNVPYTNRARLHVNYHDPHSVVPDGNLGNNMDKYLKELCFKQPEDYQEALEDIWNSDDKVEAQEKFDDLAGGIYGDWLNAQVQRQIAFNNMLSNRLVTDDMGLCQFCCQSQCAQYSSDCEPGCYQCCARRQCEFGGRICGKYPRYCEPRRSIWGSFLGNYGDGFYWKGFTKYHEESTGMAVGIEWKNVCCRVFGMYFGYSNSDIWHGHNSDNDWGVGNTYSRIKSDDFTFGLYAKWDANCMGGYWLMNGTFTYNTLDAMRSYTTQAYDNVFKADPSGLSAAAYIERGWMYVENHGFVVNPYASIQYTFATIDNFTENGTSSSFGVPVESSMNLFCYDMAFHSLRGQLGVRVSRDFIVGCNNWQILRLTLGGAYAHEFLDPQATYYTHVMGSRSMDKDFEMKSNGCSRDWANLMFSADYRLTQRLSANFQYNTYFNQYKTVNALNATLRLDF